MLLEEMEQQQEISKRLHDENQELQRRLQNQRLQYEKAKDEIENYAQTQLEMVEKQRKIMELQQNREDNDSQKKKDYDNLYNYSKRKMPSLSKKRKYWKLGLLKLNPELLQQRIRRKHQRKPNKNYYDL